MNQQDRQEIIDEMIEINVVRSKKLFLICPHCNKLVCNSYRNNDKVKCVECSMQQKVVWGKIACNTAIKSSKTQLNCICYLDQRIWSLTIMLINTLQSQIDQLEFENASLEDHLDKVLGINCYGE